MTQGGRSERFEGQEPAARPIYQKSGARRPLDELRLTFPVTGIIYGLPTWHRQGFRLFWRRESRRPGRPRIPKEVQDLIAGMARSNRTWGEERIAAELLLKLDVRPPYGYEYDLHRRDSAW
jgi:hypothetical protein